jgi:hypothetical protein
MHDESCRVSPAIVDVLREVEAEEQALPNYWERTKSRAFSKPWIVPVMLIAVGAPWIIGLVTLVRLLFDLFE